jgi:spore coat polysaccharide biosynthesis protein SpsF
MSTLCILQARMGSTRLPGKVLLPLLDRPLLAWDVYRLRKCRLIDEIVIATTTDPRDDALADLCVSEGWGCFRGSENDVLDRYYGAARQHNADTIVRITSDCPLIDPAVTDYVIATYAAAAPAADYASNVFPRTYPRGLDTEVFSFAALETAWKEDQSEWREHVTPFLWKQPERFRQINAANPVDYSSHRWTVDTPQDFELVRRIYAHFGHGDFGWRDILTILELNPNWVALNADVPQKKL